MDISEIVVIETARPKSVQLNALRHLELERVNACTWKVVDPKAAKMDVPASHGQWGGYRTTKALAWIVDLGYGQWMARCGNQVCNPTHLAAAKRQALALSVGGMGDYQVSNAIKEYQELGAIIERRYGEQFAYERVQNQPLLAPPESPYNPNGGEPVAYGADGYPDLPERLNRRPETPVARAA